MNRAPFVHQMGLLLSDLEDSGESGVGMTESGDGGGDGKNSALWES